MKLLSGRLAGRHHLGLTVVGSAFVVLVVGVMLHAAVASALDLTGVVRNKAGVALTNASIFIYTASPRVGAGYI